MDNVLKGALDALTHAGVWADDSLVADLRIVRMPAAAPGRLEVTIEPILIPTTYPGLDLL